MAALIDDYRAPRGPRQMRFRRPAWEDDEPTPVWRPARPIPSPAPPTYRRGARWLPVPSALRPYVRDEMHFARVVSVIDNRAGNCCAPALRYRGARLECAVRVLALLRESEDGTPPDFDDPLLAELVLLLVPPVPCERCGRPYLREHARRLHCSERCRVGPDFVGRKEGMAERRRAAVDAAIAAERETA